MKNTTNRFRVSVDTRWQPVEDIMLFSDAIVTFGNEEDNMIKEKEKEKDKEEMEGDDDLFAVSDVDIVDDVVEDGWKEVD